MKKIFAVLMGLMILLSSTACSRDTSNADKGDDGMIEDAGNAVDEVLDGAENVVDDVTGSDGGSNNNNKVDNNADKTTENK